MPGRVRPSAKEATDLIVRDPLGFLGGVWRSLIGRPFERWLRIRPHRFAAFGKKTLVRAPLTITCAHRVSIGRDTYIGAHALISLTEHLHGKDYEPEFKIGDRCQFGDGLVVSCCGEVTIGDDVLASERVFIADTFHEYTDPQLPPIAQPLAEPKPVRIEDGVFLGIGCCCLAGVTIGERAYVAANAVVTHDVEPWTVVAGSPAKVIRRWDGREWRRVEQAPG